jgi:hypothetical protein
MKSISTLMGLIKLSQIVTWELTRLKFCILWKKFPQQKPPAYKHHYYLNNLNIIINNGENGKLT